MLILISSIVLYFLLTMSFIYMMFAGRSFANHGVLNFIRAMLGTFLLGWLFMILYGILYAIGAILGIMDWVFDFDM